MVVVITLWLVLALRIMNMTKDPEVIEHWIRTINESGVNLTKWEEDFVDSVGEQFSKYRRISDKQEDILERIYAERTP